MTLEHIAHLCTLMAQLPSQVAWEEEKALPFYREALTPMPDEAAESLAVFLLTRAQFRPTPAELWTAWREHSQKNLPPLPSPADVVAEIRRAAQQYGRFGIAMQDPSFRKEGCPPLTPVALRVVEAFGGWLSLCTDEADPTARAGVLRRLAEDMLKREEERLIALPSAERPMSLTSGADHD